MKYFKVLLLGLLVVLIFSLSINKDVDAFGINFDFTNNSPRFQYLYDDQGDLIPFDFELRDEFDFIEDVDNFTVALDQVSYDGKFIKNLELFTTDYKVEFTNIITASYNTIAVNSLAITEMIEFDKEDYTAVVGVEVNGVGIDTALFEVYETDTTYKVLIAWNVTTTGDNIVIRLMREFADDYISRLYYDWSGLQFEDDENVVFYRVRIDNFVIFSGAVMKAPQYDLTYDVYGIEFGEFLVEDEGLIDTSDQSSYTSYLQKDRYIILHYRIPQSEIYSPKFVLITNIINNTTEDGLDTGDILALQGGDTYQFTNSFIVLPIDNIVSGGLLTDYDFINDRWGQLLNDYSEGSYYIAITDPLDSFSFIAGSTAIWNVTEDFKDPFQLKLSLEELSEGDLQRITFYKNSEYILTGFTTIFAMDYRSGDSYVDMLNASIYNYSSSYYPIDTLLLDDIVTVKWELEPLFMPYTLDPNDFTLSLTDTYTFIDDTGLAGDINNIRTIFGISDEDDSEGLIFSILVLFVINALVLLLTRNTFVLSVINIVLVSVLSFLGFITMWFILGVILLALIGIKMSVGGRTYE